jgi:hypothetical protein
LAGATLGVMTRASLAAAVSISEDDCSGDWAKSTHCRGLLNNPMTKRRLQ